MKKRILALGAVLALVAALAMPTAALAGGVGTTNVTGEIGMTYTITPPADITLGPFTAAGNYEKTGMSITVSTNDPTVTVCGIVVADKKTNNECFLTLKGAGAEPLTNALEVKGGAISPNYVPLTTQQTLIGPNTLLVSANIYDFAVSQTIVAGDLTKTAGTYGLTMTFTATFSP